MIQRRLLQISILLSVIILGSVLYQTANRIDPQKNKLVKIAAKKNLKIVGESIGGSVYQYVDEKGHLVVTNKPTAKAKLMNLPPLAVYVNPMTKNDLYAKEYTATIEPVNQSINTIEHKWWFNKKSINVSTPNINDQARRGVLAEELEHEKNALISSKELLVNASKSKLSSESTGTYQSRLQTLADNVKEHEKNIELLTKTLN